jgi:hypothetical protein
MNIVMSKIGSSYQINIPILETYQDEYVRRFLDYLRIKEITSTSLATDEDINNLSEELMEQWWEKSQHRFSK